MERPTDSDAEPAEPYPASVAVPGSTIGSWRLTAELGRGTTSVVYSAEPRSGRGDAVAIKLPLPGVLRDEASVERFLRGARTQQSLSHPAILPVLELGTDPAHGPFVVTPLAGGATLGEALAAGDLPAERALTAIEAVAGALDAAAASGVVHRDVKPSNILLGEGDQAWLVDFGLARDHEDDPTTTGALAGTLAYLAPELIKGGDPTPASDRYALACVAFQALTGRQPFPRATDAAVLFAHVDDPPPDASAVRAALPETVDLPLAAGLAKDPKDRPSSAAVLASKLAVGLGPLGRALPSPLRRIHASDATVDAITPLPIAPTTEMAAARTRRWRFGWAAAGVLLLGALTGAMLVGVGGDGPTEGEAAASLPAGFVAIGSQLPADGVRSADCEGEPPSGASRSCSISQLRLPGEQAVVPKDGLLRAWLVRGASGELALQVLRRRDGTIYQVARSEPVEIAPDQASRVHRFETELEAEAGDVLALAVQPGGTLGRRDADGAAAERWSAQVGAGSQSGVPERATELLLRAELEPGALRRPPEQLVGAAARRAPAGRELDASSATLPDGREVRVALTLVEGRLALDLSRDGVRRSRLFPKQLDPGGQLIELKAFESPGNQSQLNLIWRNPGAVRDSEQYFGLNAETLDIY